MKKPLLLVAFFAILLTVSAFSQKTGTLTINTKYVGIVEGYDHLNKTQLYVDGKLMGESESKLESQPLRFSVKLPRGKHDIKILNLAFYEGNWEEHTVANNYSVDALYEGSIELKKKKSISLIFDIDKAATEVKIK